MASSDDDFALVGEKNHHQTNPHHHSLHQPYAAYRPSTKSTQIHAPPQSTLHPPVAASATAAGSGAAANNLEGGGVGEQADDHATDSAFLDASPLSENSNPYDGEANVRKEKRTDREEQAEGDNNNKNNENGNNCAHSYKRPRASGNAGGEHRKDREEWSDEAITCLLDAYTEKVAQLNRGNLRGRDWEEVAATVTERCEKRTKTVEQCKNKVDNLKKRCKLERQRMSNGAVSVSHWPWFKKMEEIVGNSLPAKTAADEYKGSATGSPATAVKQFKRCTTMTSSPVGQTNSVKSKPISDTRWRRVVLKISGVALAGTGPNNIDPKVMTLIASEVGMACRLGIEVAIVVGGRNIFCRDTWMTATGSDRRTTYQIGMMASVMNSLLLQSEFEKAGVQTRVLTAFPICEGAEPYSRQRAIRHLEKGRVVIFGGIGAGPGNMLFSTDTSAALQASEIHAEAVLKGTNVDGVYDCHSRDNNVTFEHISFRDLVSRGATSMDMMALTCCEENGIPVVVFNLLQPGNISKALCGEQVGTLIDQTGRID